MNAKSGYNAENMNRVFESILTSLNQKSICSISVAFKEASSFLSKSVLIGSGFITLTDSNTLITHNLTFKQTAIYNFTSPKKMSLKKTIGGQKIMQGTFLNLSTQKYEKICIQFAPKVMSFPNQKANFDKFCELCEQYKTK